jgi:hypothetical protein
LGGDHGTFVKFDQCHSVRGVGVITRRRFVDGCVGVHFAFTAKGIEILGFIAAVRADIPRGKDLIVAVRANLADQPVALFFESPVSRDFHVSISFL